jgi:hypothetical protein
MLHSKPVRHGAGRTVHRYSAVLQLQPAQCGAQTDLRRYDAVLQLEQGCGQHPVQGFFGGVEGFSHIVLEHPACSLVQGGQKPFAYGISGCWPRGGAKGKI